MLPYSGDPRRSPPPPPPRAAFSSSLSPSAAPFPAADPVGPGRDLPTAPSVYAAGGDWAAASWMEPPASYLAPAAAPAATAPGYKGEASQSGPYGIYSRNHFSNFVGACSLRSESSNSASERQAGSCPEISEAFNNDFGSSVFHQQQNAFVSKLLDHSGAEDTVYPPRQDFIQYPFGSTYDKYMTQLSSCSKDSQPQIFSTRYVDSSEMAKAAVPLMNDTIGENSFSFSSYMNPIRINLDYFDCVWNEQKDHGHQTTDKQHGKWSNSDNMATAGSYPLNSLGENHVGIGHLENGRPMQESVEIKHDLGSFNSKLSSPEVGFVQPRDFSSELLEVNNTSVDSPCWKGTPASYQPSFGMMEKNDAPCTVIGTVGYISSHQSQKIPELSSEYPGRFPERQEASVSKDNPFKAFELPARCKNSKDHKEVPPVDVRVHNDMATHASYPPYKEHARTEECYDSTEDSKNVISLSQQGSPYPASKHKLVGENGGSHTASTNIVLSKSELNPIAIPHRVDGDRLTTGSPRGNCSAAAEKEEITQKRGEDPSQCYPCVEGNTLNMACDSSSSTRTIFLKLMHNLSVVLLSTCKGGSSLQEDEEELLQSVIQNLTAAKRSKMEQKYDDGLSNSSQLKFKNNNFLMAMHGHSAQETSDSEFKTTVSQVLTDHLDDKMPDSTEVSQSEIYRKLWIEAEASACKLKYELQHARMKLTAAKGHNNTLKVPDSSEGCKGSSSSISSSKPQNHGKESNTCTVALQGQGGDSGDRQSPVISRNIFNGVDTDVLARFKILQSRINSVSSFDEIGCEGRQEANKKSFPVEDAVMARLKVLKSRPDNVMASQEINKKQLDASTDRADNVDDAVMARLRILESRPNSNVMSRLRILETRPNNSTFLGQESSKQQLDESTDRVDGADDAVMARLRILKSRPGNVTSLGDASKQQEEACSDRLDDDDLSAITNTKVSTEQCWKFIQSDDLADHLGGKDSVGGIDTFGDGTGAGEIETGGSTDASTPKRCKATSDELNIEGAVHDENHVLLETAGDSNVCSEGFHGTQLISSVHQYGSAPPEWEHVLKENFFHPGK